MKNGFNITTRISFLNADKTQHIRGPPGNLVVLLKGGP